MEDRPVGIRQLIEIARSQQELAAGSLERLVVHTKGLDEIVRSEIRSTLIDELQALSEECRHAAEALQSLKHVAAVRTALWHVGFVLVSSFFAVAAAWRVLPSGSQVAELRDRREEMLAAIARIDRQGGRMDLRHCGETARLCVRVDRKASAYGPGADYLIVKGY